MYIKTKKCTGTGLGWYSVPCFANKIKYYFHIKYHFNITIIIYTYLFFVFCLHSSYIYLCEKLKMLHVCSSTFIKEDGQVVFSWVYKTIFTALLQL